MGPEIRDADGNIVTQGAYNALVAKMRFHQEEAVDMSNLWHMALKVVGLPPDASGGKFRDRINEIKAQGKEG